MKRALLALILLAAIVPQDLFARDWGRRGYYRPYVGRYVAPRTYYRPYYGSNYYRPNYYGRNYYGRYYGGYRGGYYPYSAYQRSGVYFSPGIQWYW